MYLNPQHLDSNCGASKFKHMKKISFGFMLWLCFCNLQAQPDIEWQKLYGGSKNDGALAVDFASDGSYFVAGYSSSNNFDKAYHIGREDCWVLKIAPDGQILWQKTFGGSAYDAALKIVATNDGGCIINCASNSSNVDLQGQNDVNGETISWLIKLDAQANIEWQRFMNQALTLKKTQDGGCLITSIEWGANFAATKINKLNSAGNTEWEKTISTPSSNYCNDIISTEDGGLFLVGDIIGTSGTADWWMVKLDAALEIEWERIVAGNNSDRANNVIKVEGGYLVSGNSNSYGGAYFGNLGSNDIWVMKISESGTVLWKKNFGGSNDDLSSQVSETSDGGFLILGSTSSDDFNVSYNNGFQDIWFLKINSQGILQWETTFGGENLETGAAGGFTIDDKFVIVGETSSTEGVFYEHHGGINDLLLIKTSLIE